MEPMLGFSSLECWAGGKQAAPWAKDTGACFGDREGQ